MKKLHEVKTLEEIRAYSDPYRLMILNEFYKYGKPATSKDIADIMGEVPANVYYHVKKMEKYGILVLAYTKQINGIVAKYYEPAAESIVIANFPDKQSPENLNEYIQLINSVFEQGKSEFIRNMNGNRKTITLSSEISFLTDEEYNDYLNMMKKLYSKKEKDAGTKAYYLFNGIVQVDNSKGDK